MPANYVLLGEVTLAASAASVTMANIPQTGYTDLKLVLSARANSGAVYADTRIRFNGAANDTNMNSKMLEGSGSAASSYPISYIYAPQDGSTATANTFANSELYIPNYTSSNFKSISIDSVLETNATTAYAMLGAGLASITAAISSITIINSSGDWLANSTFYLYGLAAVGTTPVIAPFATGGDIIQNDGTYWYHAFLSSGTFTPGKSLTADCLVVAGGGASGRSWSGGGGGAGGVCNQTGRTIAAGSYSITIGAGGTAGTIDANPGGNGQNTTFDNVTAVGGGGGASNGSAAATGGSGGGGSYNNNGANATQGNSGGATGFGTNGAGIGSAPSGGSYGSGGGGAGASGTSGAGRTGAGQTAGVGGNGKDTWSTWASATSTGVGGFYAGAGGGGSESSGFGGAGGSGGGGAGGSGVVGTTGTANTGGGAGGSGGTASPNIGANGGSGIVIIRYPIA